MYHALNINKYLIYFIAQTHNLSQTIPCVACLYGRTQKSFFSILKTFLSKGLLHATGFEPATPLRKTDYESVAFDHSAMHAKPILSLIAKDLQPHRVSLQVRKKVLKQVIHSKDCRVFGAKEALSIR